MYEFQAFSDITMYTMEKSQSERRKDINFRRLVNSEKQAMSYSGSVLLSSIYEYRKLRWRTQSNSTKTFACPTPALDCFTLFVRATAVHPKRQGGKGVKVFEERWDFEYAVCRKLSSTLSTNEHERGEGS